MKYEMKEIHIIYIHLFQRLFLELFHDYEGEIFVE